MRYCEYSDAQVEDALDALVAGAVTFENAEAAADVARVLQGFDPTAALALLAHTAGFSFAAIAKRCGLSGWKAASRLYDRAFADLKKGVNARVP